MLKILILHLNFSQIRGFAAPDLFLWTKILGQKKFLDRLKFVGGGAIAHFFLPAMTPLLPWLSLAIITLRVSHTVNVSV